MINHATLTSLLHLFEFPCPRPRWSAQNHLAKGFGNSLPRTSLMCLPLIFHSRTRGMQLFSNRLQLMWSIQWMQISLFPCVV